MEVHKHTRWTHMSRRNSGNPHCVHLRRENHETDSVLIPSEALYDTILPSAVAITILLFFFSPSQSVSFSPRIVHVPLCAPSELHSYSRSPIKILSFRRVIESKNGQLSGGGGSGGSSLQHQSFWTGH